MFEGIKTGAAAVKQMNAKLDVDKFEELKEEIEDQMADVNERQDFFINAGNQDDNDELLDELDELEAEMAAEDFEGMDVADDIIHVDPKKQNVPAPARAAAR